MIVSFYINQGQNALRMPAKHTKRLPILHVPAHCRAIVSSSESEVSVSKHTIDDASAEKNKRIAK